MISINPAQKQNKKDVLTKTTSWEEWEYERAC
jgi:hypothetical protein